MGSVVEESDLDFRRFHCCGDEDLYPFCCPVCERLMVFCCECDTLYTDLAERGVEVNHFDPDLPIFHCSQYSHRFTFFFMRDGLHKVERERWLAAGFGHLLRDTADAP